MGANLLLTLTTDDVADVFPHFDSPATGSFSPVIERDSKVLGRQHLVRVYLPPGYHENTLRRYPVLYMQDGKNLFFPEEAFLGQDWGVGEAVHLLDTDERRGPRGDRGRPLGRPDRRVHEAGLRSVRPLRGRGDQARDGPGPPGADVAARDGCRRVVAGRCRLVLHGLGVPAGLRLRGLHVEHLLAQGRPRRTRPLRAEARVEVLPGQRLAGRQLRGDAGHGHGPRAPRGTACARTSCTSSSRSRSTTSRPGAGGCTCPSSWASGRPPPPSAGVRSGW